jgi:hypothetical protein
MTLKARLRLTGSAPLKIQPTARAPMLLCFTPSIRAMGRACTLSYVRGGEDRRRGKLRLAIGLALFRAPHVAQRRRKRIDNAGASTP